jgi:hypothetical protein
MGKRPEIEILDYGDDKSFGLDLLRLNHWSIDVQEEHTRLRLTGGGLAFCEDQLVAEPNGCPVFNPYVVAICGISDPIQVALYSAFFIDNNEEAIVMRQKDEIENLCKDADILDTPAKIASHYRSIYPHLFVLDESESTVAKTDLQMHFRGVMLQKVFLKGERYVEPNVKKMSHIFYYAQSAIENEKPDEFQCISSRNFSCDNILEKTQKSFRMERRNWESRNERRQAKRRLKGFLHRKKTIRTAHLDHAVIQAERQRFYQDVSQMERQSSNFVEA